MKLKCKIYPKYLDKILNLEKNIEYRQVESIEFDDGKRKLEFEVFCVFNVETKREIRLIKKAYPDVKWKNKLPFIGIWLGKQISSNKKKVNR